MTKILFTLLILISVPVLLGAAQEAYGANLNLDDSVDNQITITAADFEFGTTGTGTVAGESAIFTGGWFVDNGGSPDPGSGIIYIIDSDGAVSDTISASWSTIVQTGFDISSITVTVQSSPNCENLGALPVGFVGIPEPTSLSQIQGSFLDPTTANPVSIPSNLVINFVGDEDVGCQPIGGTFIPIDQSALLLAGVQSISMWMIPVIIAGIGVGVFVIKRRS